MARPFLYSEGDIMVDRVALGGILLRYAGELRVVHQQLGAGNGGAVNACAGQQSRKWILDRGGVVSDERGVALRKRAKKLLWDVLDRRTGDRLMNSVVSNVIHF